MSIRQEAVPVPYGKIIAIPPVDELRKTTAPGGPRTGDVVGDLLCRKRSIKHHDLVDGHRVACRAELGRIDFMILELSSLGHDRLAKLAVAIDSDLAGVGHVMAT